jgi:DNA mismatch repair protein MutS2
MPPSEHPPFPDLLHPVPFRRVDAEGTRLAIALAFAGGVSGGLFAEALEAAKIAPSTWEPSSFADDLFLANFVSSSFRVRVGGDLFPLATRHLTSLLAHPPLDPGVVAHRRAIVHELATVPALRQALERLYVLLARFRTVLEGATGLEKWDANRRQLDILVVVKDVFDAMTGGFAFATSGLRGLFEFGSRVQASEPYRSLADLLHYDERLATLDLKVRVGADGRIRGLEVARVRENDESVFVSSPWRRWLAKLELFVRGYRFGDGEVMARLIDAVFSGLESDVTAFVQLLGDVEFYLGAFGFADAAAAAGLAVSLPDLVPPTESRTLHGLFNPHLLAHGVVPVPCDLTTDDHGVTTLVTGPNSGGKTRLLQSLGLAQLLAQSGLFVPARAARMALAPGLVVSLIQETKADQSEGRLGTELVRIRGLFERLPPGAMVLLDELCSGTNPSEGEEIFELVIEMLARLTPQAFITTHFLAFAARLERERKIAGLRFLQVELGANKEPTYQFVPGVAQTSLAGHAAARLGVTGEQLLALIERNIAAGRARAAGTPRA